jgi:hypothetical protein
LLDVSSSIPSAPTKPSVPTLTPVTAGIATALLLLVNVKACGEGACDGGGLV